MAPRNPASHTRPLWLFGASFVCPTSSHLVEGTGPAAGAVVSSETMRVMFTYADHNFLIDCANNPNWRQAVAAAVAQSRVTIVLSPWSIYEIANTTEERMEDLIQIVADFQLAWIPERADIQLLEGVPAKRGFRQLRLSDSPSFS